MKRVLSLALAMALLFAAAAAEEDSWTCPNCGETVEARYPFCPWCAYARETPEPTEEPDQYWLCTRCGNFTEARFPFCPFCAGSWEETALKEGEWYCGNCQKVNRGGFCGKCGKSREEAAVRPPEPTPTPTPTPKTTTETVQSISTDRSGITVYATSGGQYFHTVRDCSGMKGASSMTLLNALKAGKNACPRCCSEADTKVYCTSDRAYYHYYATCSDMKNVSSMTLAQAMVLGKKCCPKCYRIPVPEAICKAKVGDTVTFGTYPHTSAGNDQTAIEWIVLEKTDYTVVLLTKYALDCKPYNKTRTDVTWETCSLREWLNGDFYDIAFSEDEKKTIAKTHIANNDDPNNGTTGGNDTEDYVYLLSLEEMEQYYKYTVDKGSSIYGQSDKLIAKPTEYAKSQGVVYWSDDNGACWYWLRTTVSPWEAALVILDEPEGAVGNDVDNTVIAVRPVITLRLSE